DLPSVTSQPLSIDPFHGRFSRPVKPNATRETYHSFGEANLIDRWQSANHPEHDSAGAQTQYIRQWICDVLQPRWLQFDSVPICNFAEARFRHETGGAQCGVKVENGIFTTWNLTHRDWQSRFWSEAERKSLCGEPGPEMARESRMSVNTNPKLSRK